MKHRFNLRVYALIIDEHKRILLSDEFRFGHFFTKFPGGVEANEGVIDALRRELQEELSAEMLDSSFFYFNDFALIIKSHKITHYWQAFYPIIKWRTAG